MAQETASMEIIKPWRGFEIRYALLDFDGTISLIREGWRELMIPYFIEVLSATNSGETQAEIRTCVEDFVDTLTGKQTIYQCIRLDEEVVRRGGASRDPLDYKQEYLRRLELRIHARKTALEQGTDVPEDHMVPGAMQMIKLLQQHGIRCYLASGTDEADVLYEAKLLGLEGAFSGGIFGARDEMLSCSKELVIQDMLQREKIQPKQLVSFGDGYVEVELVEKLGGLTVGLATNEESRQGINQWKRSRLIKAGAHAIAPDFRCADEIFAAIGRDCSAV